jgi:hypothetical protein
MSKYLEKIVIKSAIAELLSHGFSLSVNDGGETTLVRSFDADAIFGAMMTTDEDNLHAHRPGVDGGGWVRFIYGNDGWDVMNDYSTVLEPYLIKTNALIDEMQE